MPEICLTCRKSFKKARSTRICPECGQPTHRLHHNFRAPRSTAIREWDLVAFLVEEGYDFSGWVRRRCGPESVLERPGYPVNLREAREFIALWAPASSQKEAGNATPRREERLRDFGADDEPQ